MVSLSAKESETYEWNSVPIAGGGFVPGFVFHPAEEGLAYARTDMGGAYRRDSQEGPWVAMLDWVKSGDSSLWGVESVAVDPQDPDRLYLACGVSTFELAPDGEILISDDRGRSFERIRMPIKFGGNENGRGNGERMMVDPMNSDVIYLGTRLDGLWCSEDRGHSWARVESFPSYVEQNPYEPNIRDAMMWIWQQRGAGVIRVVFDPAGGSKDGKTAHILVAESLMGRDNLFESKDAGETWAPVQGHPKHLRVTSMNLAANGVLYLTLGDNPGPGRMTRGEVWRYELASGEWTDITPEEATDEHTQGYASVAVDSQNPDRLLVSSFYRKGGEELYRSTDGGASWTRLFEEGLIEFDHSKAPYVGGFPIHWMFDVEIDPFDANHAMFTTGYGGHETFNLMEVDEDRPSTWEIVAEGIEETVALDLLSPPTGPALFSAVGDYNGFVHWDLSKVDPTGGYRDPLFNNTESIDCAWLKPEVVVRVGRSNRGGPTIAYSMDQGKSWSDTENVPFEGAGRGRIAVSADGAVWVWTPEHGIPYRTEDRGATWQSCGLDMVDLRVNPDRVNPTRFYAMEYHQEASVLWVSDDAGKSFVAHPVSIPFITPPSEFGHWHRRGDARGAQDRLYAVPGIFNELWFPSWDGLFYKPADADDFHQVSSMKHLSAFGFGKPAPGSDYHTLYIAGILEGVYGVYRSTDKGRSWVMINDEQHQWSNLLYVIGDPKVYGRVYIGTHGRGILYGDPK